MPHLLRQCAGDAFAFKNVALRLRSERPADRPMLCTVNWSTA
ncbi:hypothetical protein ACWDYK_08100 [Streptomyces anthocyanicus]|nr:hypothetical protein OHA15_40945 [Streptomyces anthocyanicus]